MDYKTIRVNGEQKRLHRHIMEEHLGRRLGYNEIVHHVDEDSTNNDLGNLALLTRREHLTIHSNVRKAAILARTKYAIEHSMICQMYVNQEKTAKTISETLGIPLPTINWYLRKYGIKHPAQDCQECGARAKYRIKRLCNKCYQKHYHAQKRGFNV